METAICSITDEGKRLKQFIDKHVKELIQRIKEQESIQMMEFSKIREDLGRDVENPNRCEQQLKTFQQDVYYSASKWNNYNQILIS